MIKRQNTTFKGDVIRLLSGTGLAQIITIAATPILTRLFGPEAFGQGAMFATITGVLAVVACMSYEYAIVSPKSHKQAANLLVVSIIICTLFVCGIVAPLIFLFGVNLLSWVRMEELQPVLLLIPLMVWISGVFMALNYWNTRTKHFTRLSIAKVVGAGAGTGGSLSFGFAGFATGLYLIIGQMVGQTVSAFVLGGQIVRDNGRFILTSLSWRMSKLLLGRYRNFPIYYTGSNFINSLSVHLPVILFGVFFSPAVVGFYALALRVLQAPMGLLGNAISQVFHEKSINARLDGTLSELVTSTFKKLVAIGFFPILATGIFAFELFGFVFGAKWAEAGLYAAILSPWLSLMFISSPISILTAVIDLQRFSLIFNSLIFIFRGLAIIVGGLHESVLLALALFSLVGTFGYLIKIIIINYYSGVPPKTTLLTMTKPFFASMLILVIYSTLKFISIEGLIYVLMYFLLILFWFWRLNSKGFFCGKDISN